MDLRHPIQLWHCTGIEPVINLGRVTLRENVAHVVGIEPTLWSLIRGRGYSPMCTANMHFTYITLKIWRKVTESNSHRATNSMGRFSRPIAYHYALQSNCGSPLGSLTQILRFMRSVLLDTMSYRTLIDNWLARSSSCCQQLISFYQRN